MEKHCNNCSHCTSIPCGTNGFEYPKLVCDKNKSKFYVGIERKLGICENWEAEGIPFYLQKQKKDSWQNTIDLI